MTRHLPTLAEAKAQARRLRSDLGANGSEITHGKSLETVAHQHGFRDWNTFRAALGNRPPDGFAPGGRVSGRYLSHPFEATIHAVEQLGSDRYRLVLDLGTPVDVVTSERFSNWRKRIRGTIGPGGHSAERTSDGRPHLELDL